MAKNAYYFRVQTHFSPDLRDLNRSCQQISHADQIVSGCGEGENPADAKQTAVPCFAQHSNGLHPAEYFLDSFAFLLADFVTGVTSGALVNGASARAFGVLRNMGRDVHTT